MKRVAPILLLWIGTTFARAQDTFSILAFDSLTREVGAAGASCVDLTGSSFTNHFITELFPDSGAVATQAAYTTINQAHARKHFRMGETPQQIIAFLSTGILGPEIRQFGVVHIDHPSAAFTGTACTDYKNHIVGPNYTIHGNILLGQGILDSMEARFNRETGDLACKLMAALQGAKQRGADTRCHDNNSSSLFAFLKVTKPTDTFGNPSFLVGLRTAMGDSIEPIDSLQKLFDLAHACPQPTFSGLPDRQNGLRVYPNPAAGQVVVEGPSGEQFKAVITDQAGRTLAEKTGRGTFTIDLPAGAPGLLILEVRGGSGTLHRQKLVPARE